MNNDHLKRFIEGLYGFEQLGQKKVNNNQNIKQCEVNILSPQDKCTIGTTFKYTLNGREMIITDVIDDLTIRLSDNISITFFKELTKDNVKNIAIFLNVMDKNINVRLIKLEEFNLDLSLLEGEIDIKSITIRDYNEIVACNRKIKEQERYFKIIQDSLVDVSKLLGEDYMKTIGHVREFLNSREFKKS